MSDRLISANSLISKLLVNSKGEMIPEHDCDNFPITLTIREVKDLIKNEPTAYDVDEKCRQLEKELHYDSGYPYCSEYDYAYGEAMLKAKETALDIVKGGGTDE